MERESEAKFARVVKGAVVTPARDGEEVPHHGWSILDAMASIVTFGTGGGTVVTPNYGESSHDCIPFIVGRL